MVDQERYLDELKQFLRIPSISSDPAHKDDCVQAARFTLQQLEHAGLKNTRLIEGDGHPLVYGEWLEAPGRPTLLLYGHYDVQPPDPLEEWLSPPFEPVIQNNNIYARGAADDKGLTLVLIKAVERLLQRDGALPVNIRVLIEGEEESGGHHIEHYVRANASELQADAVLISDTEMFGPDLPTLMTGLRGIVYGEIHVKAADQDLHSGTYGGVAPNAVMAAAEIVSALKDREGRIHIPGFLDRVQPPSGTERQAWASLPFDAESFAKNEAKVSMLTGEPEFGPLERMWARPTFEVHGIRGGFTGEGAKTVIPAKAVAKISLRLVPDQRPGEVVQQVKDAVKAATPLGIEAEFRALQSAPPCSIATGNRFIAIAAKALEQIFGNDTIYMRAGGSIPIVALFAEVLHAPAVLMGFGLPDDNLHSPNEKLYLPNFFRGIDAVELYLKML